MSLRNRNTAFKKITRYLKDSDTLSAYEKAGACFKIERDLKVLQLIK